MSEQINEIAIMQAKLDQIVEVQTEIKDELKQDKQWSEEHIEEIRQKTNKNEQDIKILETKIAMLEKKWDLPNKLLITVLTAIVTAVLTLILK